MRLVKPILRFPEFSSDWEEKKLKDIVYINPKCNDTKPDVINYIDLESVNGNKVTDIKKIYKENAPSRAQRIAKDQDIFFQTVRPYQQNNFIYNFDIHNIVVSTGYAQIRVHQNAYYVFTLLHTYRFLTNVLMNCTGSNYPAISGTDLSSVKVIYSSDEGEQRKIGDFFSKLDRQIELEEQKLAKLEEQKKGYMQKLFSQELRFKDQDGNHYPKWEKKFIKDIFIFENNRRKPITSSLREKGLYPYYGATGIIDYVKDYLFNNEERLLIGEDGAKWGKFEKSSFIANGQYWVNNHAHVVKSNNHNLYFMNYYLNFKELRTFVTGNAPAKLTHENLCNINLEIPCLNEQGKISALLKSIDNKMNNQINKIVLLKRRKQGLLQKMFV